MSTAAPLGLVCTTRSPMPSAATGAAMYRSATSVTADVSAIRNTAAAASLNRDIGRSAGTDCLTGSAGAGAGLSVAGAAGLSQNPGFAEAGGFTVAAVAGGAALASVAAAGRLVGA